MIAYRRLESVPLEEENGRSHSAAGRGGGARATPALPARGSRGTLGEDTEPSPKGKGMEFKGKSVGVGVFVLPSSMRFVVYREHGCSLAQALGEGRARRWARRERQPRCWKLWRVAFVTFSVSQQKLRSLQLPLRVY